MENDKKISVIVPCHNVEKYVDRCLKSIADQTIGIDNLEIILIDDASEDDTREHLYAFEKKYPKQTILITSDENIKLSAARNTGFQYVTGEYVTFIDSDDFIANEMFEKMYEKATQYNCDMVECKYLSFSNEDQCVVSDMGNDRYYDMKKDADKRDYIVEKGFKCAVWGRLYKRSFLKDNDMQFIEGLLYEDVYYSGLAMFLYSSVYSMKETYYYYFSNDTGIIKTSDIKKALDLINNIKYMLEGLKDRGLLKEALDTYHDELEFYCVWKGFVDALTMLLNSAQFPSGEDILVFKRFILNLFPRANENKYLLQLAEQSEVYRSIVGMLS